MKKVLGKTKLEPWPMIVRTRRLKWFGKMVCLNGSIYSSSLCFLLCFRTIQKTQRETTKDMVKHNVQFKKREKHPCNYVIVESLNSHLLNLIVWKSCFDQIQFFFYRMALYRFKLHNQICDEDIY